MSLSCQRSFDTFITVTIVLDAMMIAFDMMRKYKTFSNLPSKSKVSYAAVEPLDRRTPERLPSNKYSLAYLQLSQK